MENIKKAKTRYIRIISKGKGHPRTGREGPEGE
jgi:hypothetical protein